MAASPSAEGTGGEVRSSIISGLAAGLGRDKGTCPLCGTAFSHRNRHHHCRQCGTLTCDDCSKHRLRLPGDNSGNKVRICDNCVKQRTEDHAAHVEEELDVSAQIISQLRSNLMLRYRQLEAYKRVLLQLEADATGNRALLQKYESDPESDAYSFNVLQELAQQRWSELLAKLESRPAERQQLLDAQKELLQQLETVTAEEAALRGERARLDERLAEATRVRAEKDELVRSELKLQEAVESARKRILELENEREAQERREEERRRRWNLGRVIGREQGGGREAASIGSDGQQPSSYTITAGIEDPLVGGQPRSRLEGCRRQCTVM
eukprot:TRINITY_DN17897_c0_g1_i1.p1 TRINITY_DN17897_c0_g1~~TRINITY_DN17897_c0_g1_i1.p1  ORF type:complete len:325 (+),score=83.07 TRINITY_DN17897_c0_g1_i1:127-1101(+)